MKRTLPVLLALPLLACTASDTPDVCGEAAAIMDSCHGGAPAGYAEACQSDDDLRAAAQGLVEGGCTPRPEAGKGDGILKTLFVAHCAPALTVGYAINRARNGDGRALSAELKAFLRPWYGAIVDRVRVTWDAELLDNWDDAGIETEHWVGAQTFGNAIFVAPRQNQRAILAHELSHTRQVHRLGSFYAFSVAYCAGYYDAGFSYSGNRMEVEANSDEDVVLGRK